MRAVGIWPGIGTATSVAGNTTTVGIGIAIGISEIATTVAGVGAGTVDSREGPAAAERPRLLRELVPQPSPVLYVDHVAGSGVALFDGVCARDMEGTVAKLANGMYTPKATTWVKSKNRGVLAGRRTARLFRSGEDGGGLTSDRVVYDTPSFTRHHRNRVVVLLPMATSR